ncbi:MAG: iron export ABC transporter permease subunit FetB [Phycisphaerae bacterium]
MNNGTVEISLPRLAALYLLLLPSLAIIIHYELGITKKLLISVLRMSLQLLLVGVFLKYIFILNNPLLNIGWLFIMLMAANLSVMSNASLNRKYFFLPIFIAITISTGFVAAFMMCIVVTPEPLYDARYLIPLTGMLLGNSMRGNVLILERFYNKLDDNRKLYSSYLLMGATKNEAIRPFVAEAMRASLMPTVAVMGTIGIVSLPGIMTGQILGGSLPFTAIKYQIAIMLGIFISMSFTGFLNIKLSTRTTFDKFDNLNTDIFKG